MRRQAGVIPFKYQHQGPRNLALHIENKATGKKSPLRIENGVYMMEMLVVPFPGPTKCAISRLLTVTCQLRLAMIQRKSQDLYILLKGKVKMVRWNLRRKSSSE